MENEMLYKWRKNILDLFLNIALVAGLVIYLLNIMTIFKSGKAFMQLIFGSISFVILLLMRYSKKIKYEIKGMVIIFILYFVGMYSFFRSGLTGTGKVFYIFVPILAIIVLGSKYFAICTGISSFVILIIMILGYTGILDNILILEHAKVGGEYWIEYGLDAIIILFLTYYLLKKLYTKLLETVKLEHDQNIQMIVLNKKLLKEIEDKEILEYKLREIAAQDDLTKMMNRRAGIIRLDKEIRKIKAEGGVLSICFLDLDNLKEINDKNGHSAGDKILERFADICKQFLRDNDFVFRYGGDEFLLILSEAGFGTAAKVMQRLSENIIAQEDLSFSYGIAEVNKDTEDDIDKLIKIADNKMYQKKIMKKWYKK